MVATHVDGLFVIIIANPFINKNVILPGLRPVVGIKMFTDHLREHGYAVVPGVISPDEAGVYYGRMWDWLESGKDGIKRGDRSTWTRGNIPNNLHGIIKAHECAYAQYVIDMRSDPRVIDIFSKIWGTSELLTSMDSINIMIPKNDSSKPFSYNPWWHVDQSYKKDGFTCVQGFINLLPCGPDDGGLMVMKDSHKLHKSFFEAFPDARGKDDWYKFKTQDELDFFSGCERIKVCCMPGDMVLWDSRTVHYATPPTSGASLRAAIYTSMEPASRASPKDLAKKRKAFNERRVTNHWSAKVKMNPKTPRYWNEGDKAHYESFHFPREVLSMSETAKRVFGLTPY